MSGLWSFIKKRLVLGLIMALIAIMSGWALPPNVIADKATQEYYTH